MADNSLSQGERDRKAQEEMSFAWERIKEFATGAAKAITTDLPGFAMDLADKISGNTERLGDKNRSAQLFEKATGIKSTGSPAENLGGMISPETLTKAMIVSAARLAKLPGSAINTIKAEEMITAGAKNSEIYPVTGVYKDKDFSRKSALSDSEAKINVEPDTQNPGKLRVITPDFLTTKLPKVLEHPTLYKLYPELEDVKVLTNYTYPPGSATYYPGFKTLTLGPGESVDQLRSSMLHEVQHVVSKLDNGIKGGSPEQFLSYSPSKLAEKIKKYKTDPDPSIRAAADRLEASSKLKQTEAFLKYEAIPGEQEARFTQSTRNLYEMELAKQVQSMLLKEQTPSSYLPSK